jgi:hypothetical protein
MFSGAQDLRHHRNHQEQNKGNNDYEFDQGENALNVVTPPHSERVRIEDTTRNYARFTLHELRMLPN